MALTPEEQMWENVYRALAMAPWEDRIAMLQEVIQQEGPAPDAYEHRIRSLLRQPSPPPHEEKRATYPDDNLLTLNKVKFGATQTIPDNVLRDLPVDVSVVEDIFVQGLVMRMKMSVFGKQLPDEKFTQTERLSVPATWWQYWKWEHRASRFWGWVAKRWPVRKKSWNVTLRLDISRALTFPELTTQFPQHPVVQIAKHTTWDPTEFFE